MQIMKKDVFLSVYLDTRRPLKNGKCPVKLGVYTPKPRKRKLYPTPFEYEEEEFNKIWNNSKPTREQREERKKIQAYEDNAQEIADSLPYFSFELFEKRMNRRSGDSTSISYHFEQLIEKYKDQGRIGTAQSYKDSERSIRKYCEEKKKQDYGKLLFYSIDTDWLEGYERWMEEEQNKSITTIGIYLRPLRHIFNIAREDEDIPEAVYPFRKYKIPSSNKTKRALSRQQLKILLDAEPENREQEKARDFWFFSYAGNGMNIKDIVNLRFDDIDFENRKLSFYRAKTRITSKSHRRKIAVYLTDFMISIIDKYGKEGRPEKDYVFNIIEDKMSPEDKHRVVKLFTRYINQYIKILAENVGLPGDISTYWARHSFATEGIRRGASMEFMQEALGHASSKTTQDYFNGFDDNTKREFAEHIMDFD